MFVEIQGEGGNERERRKYREEQAIGAAIAKHDAECVPDEAQQIAETQMNNVVRRIAFDYAAIVRGRAVRPELFLMLPSDVECRKALGLPELTDVERVEILKRRIKK